jgi:nitrogen fixation/metabolism regulation signal transduction histidine kinase
VAAPVDRRVLGFALLAGLPAVVVALTVIARSALPGPVRTVLLLGVGGTWLAGAFAARAAVVNPLHTLANLMAGVRQGDFSLRARDADAGDPMGAVWLEFNSLGDGLQQQRLGALEATALLRRIMEEIDVAILAFDAERRLQLVNRAGERLLGDPAERLIGRTDAELGLGAVLALPPGRTLDATFPGGSGRWEVRRSTFRQGGRPLEMIVLADLTRALREEERVAWQRLVRVLSHEINNSLAPIHSLAGTLTGLLDRSPRPADAEADLRRGLEIIATRSEALNRVMASYARLARLPAPVPSDVNVGEWVGRVAALVASPQVSTVPGPPLTLRGDGDQLDQLLINLVKNALEAVGDRGAVEIGWRVLDRMTVELWVRDDGPGLASSANLFVPFFTTKPGGTGIGLALCRQIAEAHGGSLILTNRGDAPGALARLRLPLVQERREA